MAAKQSPPSWSSDTEAAPPAPPAAATDTLGDRDDVPVGKRVSSYVIEEMRQRGGFATVYRARHASTGETVAIKVLHGFLAASATILRRFQKEVEAIRRINHPNIVAVHEFGELSPGRPYFVMEWLEGRNLSEEVSVRRAFSVAEALAVVEELGSALSAVHGAGVVHRDLKSSNVMLVRDGERYVVKLVDFGIAKLTHPDGASASISSGMTRTGEMLGSPHYMAPEQILCQPVSPRTDIYSLGVVLFELLTGSVPFRAQTNVAVGELHLRAPAPHASEVSAVPAAVDAVIQKCLSKDPVDRYGTVEEMVVALRNVVSSLSKEERDGELRPEGWLSEKPVEAIGCYVEVQILCDDDAVDDALLNALDVRLSETRERLGAAGLAVAMDSGTALLLAAMVPTTEAEGRVLRSRVLRAALALQESARAADRADGRLRTVVTVHVASAATLTAEGITEYVGGDLLHVGRWTGDHPGDGLLATEKAVAGLQDMLELAPVSGQDGRYRVSGTHG